MAGYAQWENDQRLFPAGREPMRANSSPCAESPSDSATMPAPALSADLLSFGAGWTGGFLDLSHTDIAQYKAGLQGPPAFGGEIPVQVLSVRDGRKREISPIHVSIDRARCRAMSGGIEGLLSQWAKNDFFAIFLWKNRQHTRFAQGSLNGQWANRVYANAVRIGQIRHSPLN